MFVVTIATTLLAILLLPAGECGVLAKKRNVQAGNVHYTGVNNSFEDPAVTRFRDYLRIQTVEPNPDAGYQEAIKFLQNISNDLTLGFQRWDLGPGNEFAVCMTWNGSDPSMKSVLFNSHMDVVAVQEQNWKFPPFEAHKDTNGDIYARGATDMKCATMGTLEAIRRLKAQYFTPLRTIHVCVIPDEEEGGLRGMKPFVASQFFEDLNVGIDIDEGGTNSENNSVAIYYAEKSPWEFNITARGEAAHGSNLPQWTSGQRLFVAMQKLFEFRDKQFQSLVNGDTPFEKLTTINLVDLMGGIATNVIPSELAATFDMRIRVTPEFNFTTAAKLLEEAVEAAKVDSNDPNVVSLDFNLKSMEIGETVHDDSNPWWTVVQEACQEWGMGMGIKCPASVTPAYSDGRYVREVGIPVFGIGPFLNTPFTGHMDNELMNEKEFLASIPRYESLIKRLSSHPK